MNRSSMFTRKVVYIAIIGALLIPLSFISRPATRDQDDQIRDEGGTLSQMRNELNIAQANLSEVDPGSETMKLASLGLRGVAVNILWWKAREAKDKKNWDAFSSTLNSLVKIQPNFVRVWEYQGHNLAYNVSVEFDDYEQRYHWVKKGISFLTRGIAYNRRDNRILDNLGFFCGHKFGESDERYQYRRLFRNDRDFHGEMGSFVNIDQINTPYGPDHWLLAYQWYDKMQELVDIGVDGTPVTKYKYDMVFYQYRPAQLRNMGMSLHREFRADEYEKTNWARAHEEWMAYGNRPITAGGGLEITLEGLTNSMKKIVDLREQLDALVPGVREDLQAKAMESVSPADRDLLNAPIDSLDDEQLTRVRKIEKTLLMKNHDLELQLARRAKPEDQREGERLAASILQEMILMEASDKSRNTINYVHWKYHTLVEATDLALAARQAEYDAAELQRRAIFDSYIERDPISGEETELPGAIQKYDEAFAIWAEVIKEYPTLKAGPLMDDTVDVIREYRGVRAEAGMETWPEDFPLQFAIDHRATLPQVYDDLPTSTDIQEMLEDRDIRRAFRLPTRPNIDFSMPTDQ